MASKRNDILNYIKAQLVAQTGFPWHIGSTLPAEALKRPLTGWINWTQDTGERVDGSASQRTLDVVFAVVCKLDPLNTEAHLERLSESYDAVHANLELIADGDAGGLVTTMREQAGGVQASGYADQDSIATVASGWTLEYRRNIGQA